jgi:hypothetical protein
MSRNIVGRGIGITILAFSDFASSRASAPSRLT